MISNVELRVPVSEADHAQGREDAPLTLVEYGDYECPSCGGAYWSVQKLREAFGDDLRFVFRNFPLANSHPHAMIAAQAAEAAALAGKFWRMHDLLYENQERLGERAIFEFAARLKLERASFARELEDPAVEARIRADFYGGARSGVNGTPTFYLNGFRYDGPWAFESMRDELEQALVTGRAASARKPTDRRAPATTPRVAR